MILQRPVVFTFREAEILEQLCRDGATNREIAARLGLKWPTVKVHISAIKRKLKANNRSHIIILCLRRRYEHL